MGIIICLSTHVGVRVWTSLLYDYGQSCQYVCRYIFVLVTMYVFMCRYVYVYKYDCFMYVHMCTYCICVYYDYVQHCEDTVRVELHYINQIYYYNYLKLGLQCGST